MENRAQQRLQRVSAHLCVSSHTRASERVCVSSETLSGKYDYTDDVCAPKFLSEKQRRFYEKNGYIVIKDLYPAEKLEMYRKRFVDICEGKVERSLGMTVMRDVTLAKQGVPANDERRVTKIQNYQDDEVLMNYAEDTRVLDYVSCFTGPNVMAVHTMLINKPPDTGSGSSRHPLHQDLHYFPFRPANRIVCSWTAMQKVTRENGCLVVIPGSHKEPGRLLAHGYPQWEGGVNKMYHGILEDINMDARIHLPMEAGDTVFFHPLLFHGSGSNRTAGMRKSISCHFADADCVYIDVKGTTQETIAEEVTSIAKRKIGFEVEFTDVWRAKSRLVRGKAGSMC